MKAEYIVKYQFVNSETPVKSISVSNNGKYLAVAQLSSEINSPTLYILEMNSGKIVSIIEESDNFKNNIWKVIFSKDDKYLIYLKQILDECYIVVYDIEKKEKNNIMKGNSVDKFMGFTITPKNEFAISVDNSIELWDLSDKNVKSKNAIKDMTEISDLHSFISISYSPSNKYYAIGGIKEGEVDIYDCKTNDLIFTLTANFSFPGAIVFDQNNKYIAVLDYWAKGLFVWNIENNFEKVHDYYFDENMEKVQSIIFDIESNNIVLGYLTSHIVIIDLESLDEIYTDKIHTGRIFDIVFSPDGKYLISGGEDSQIIVRELIS